jgi:hypothetical protein
VNYTGLKTNIKTTCQLQIGDVIKNGNVFDGFLYYVVVAIQDIPLKPRSKKLTIQFNHGGSESLTVGLNAHWDVVL